jgi:hypothetical protein
MQSFGEPHESIATQLSAYGRFLYWLAFRNQAFPENIQPEKPALKNQSLVPALAEDFLKSLLQGAVASAVCQKPGMEERLI